MQIQSVRSVVRMYVPSKVQVVRMYVPSSESTISSASEEEHPEMYFSERLNQHCPISKISHTASLRSVMSSKCIDF